jgi:hypothetical protein
VRAVTPPATSNKWVVGETRAVDPTPGAECDASYLVTLTRGESKVRSMVEFVAPAAVASIGYAREVLAPFLADDEVPRRLIVSRDGSVRVVDPA